MSTDRLTTQSGTITMKTALCASLVISNAWKTNSLIRLKYVSQACAAELNCSAVSAEKKSWICPEVSV